MSDIAIYAAPSGTVEVRLATDTVWLRREQMAELFSRDRTVIGRHIRNAFAEGELDEESNVQNLHIAGSDKPVGFYSLDVIISVGYRVKSQEATRFRQWATGVLRQHLTQGYSLNRQRLESNARELDAALQLVRRVAASPDLSLDAGCDLVDIVSRYAQTFALLQGYDEGELELEATAEDSPAVRGRLRDSHKWSLLRLRAFALAERDQRRVDAHDRLHPDKDFRLHYPRPNAAFCHRLSPNAWLFPTVFRNIPPNNTRHASPRKRTRAGFFMGARHP